MISNSKIQEISPGNVGAQLEGLNAPWVARAIKLRTKRSRVQLGDRGTQAYAVRTVSRSCWCNLYL